MPAGSRGAVIAGAARGFLQGAGRSRSLAALGMTPRGCVPLDPRLPHGCASNGCARACQPVTCRASGTDTPRRVTPSPTIAIVGSAGTYGRWLRGFFERRMGLCVLGHDPGDPGSDTPETLVEQADVLLFATPIRQTTEVIDDYVRRSAGREARRRG